MATRAATATAGAGGGGGGGSAFTPQTLPSDASLHVNTDGTSTAEIPNDDGTVDRITFDQNGKVIRTESHVAPSAAPSDGDTGVVPSLGDGTPLDAQGSATGDEIRGAEANRPTPPRQGDEQSGQNPANPNPPDTQTGSGNGTGTASGSGGSSPSAPTIPDETVVVRGGTNPIDPPGKVFSGAQGSTVDEAAAGVPHGQIRVATAGDIRAGGGTVAYAPEFNPNVGRINYQHVDVTVGEGSDPFSDLMRNPIPRNGRFGGPDYPYGEWEP